MAWDKPPEMPPSMWDVTSTSRIPTPIPNYPGKAQIIRKTPKLEDILNGKD